MASYSEYQENAMPTAGDFPLYGGWSSGPVYFDDSQYLSTSLDAFPQQFAFDQSFGDHYSFNQNHHYEIKNHARGFSPANSTAPSFEYQQPPNLSSTSDSGASVQSTISSAMASPSVRPQQSNEWTNQMHKIPTIAHHESNASHDLLATTGFETEGISIMDKACVGESTKFPSSQSSYPSFPLQNRQEPGDSMWLSGQSQALSSPELWTTRDAFAHTRECAQPQAVPQAPLTQPGVIAQARGGSTSPEGTYFKPPTTPASTTSPLQARSPTFERIRGQRRTSVVPPVRHDRGVSPLNQSMSYSEDDMPQRPHATLSTVSSPFFSQSSGHFVPPLGSSYPTLINPFSPNTMAQIPERHAVQSPHDTVYPAVPSPAPSRTMIRSPRMSHGKMATSPRATSQSWQPYPALNGSRRPSVSSIHSRNSQGSMSSDDSNKGLCPIATCGRHFKDLKAHMLTHQNERPEKCPIPTCEYHTKGFARKYDKNRHTLTHYKGTMVCGFCPGSGSAVEKSFNRADVFKRHLTSVHGVEQTPPNARRKSPSGVPKKQGYGVRDIPGQCSTCGITFANAQDFYEHLDDCVLRVVQQAEPSEAINEKLLSSIADDPAVQETMERHMLPTTVDYDAPTSFDEEEEEDDDEAEDDANDTTYGTRDRKAASRSRKAGNSSLQSTHSRGVSAQHVGGGSHVTSGGAIGKPGQMTRKQGLTLSRSGVPLSGPATAGKGSKRRKNYPLSWGAAPEKMRMKKRVLCVFDGPRRLWKDDMMLDGDHEVRIPLPGVGDGRRWTTDLDVQTLKRADGVLNATEEEKGPWLDEEALEQLMQ